MDQEEMVRRMAELSTVIKQVLPDIRDQLRAIWNKIEGPNGDGLSGRLVRVESCMRNIEKELKEGPSGSVMHRLTQVEFETSQNTEEISGIKAERGKYEKKVFSWFVKTWVGIGAMGLLAMGINVFQAITGLKIMDFFR